MKQVKLGKRDRNNYVQLATDLCYTECTITAIRNANTEQDVQHILLNARKNGGDYRCLSVK